MCFIEDGKEENIMSNKQKKFLELLRYSCLTSVISLGFMTIIASGTSPYIRFYFDNTGGIDITTSSSFIISQDDPQIFRGNFDNRESDSYHVR